jgi:hypothetical protein
MRGKYNLLIAAAFLMLFLAACGAGSGGGPTGTAVLSLTDAPGDEIAFDNVLVTVKAVWFHTSDAAGEGDGGWLVYPLSSPKTVDLARLTDGAISQMFNQTLPVGHYQQIRIILAATEDNTYLSPYNNEAIVGGVAYSLRVPAAAHGIRLAGSFQVVEGGTLNLAIDFDIGHDVVPFQNPGNGNREFLLKPRLRYFDLDSVGSITGRIDAATRAVGYHFVFKAEQLEAGPGKDNTYHVRRFTTAGYLGDNTAFRLSFLKPGTYDVVMRGRNVDTVIVRGVTVTSGTNTDLGPAINMPTGVGEFFANTRVSPTGSWVNFYQTLDNNAAGTAMEYPYEIRFRHVCPLTGIFFDNIALSNGKLHLRGYSGGTTTLIAGNVTPQEWTGGGGNARFGAVADAFLFDRSASVIFDNTASGPISGIPGPTFGARLAVSAPAVSAIASGAILSHMNKPMTLDKVYLLAVHGGRVVDSFIPTQSSGPMTWTMSGGRMQAPYAFLPLPGNIPGSVYGIDGLGWSPPGSPNGPAFAVGTAPAIADLRAGDDTAANFTMNRIIP